VNTKGGDAQRRQRFNAVHLLALSGYQFFDLDGREPDPGVVNFGRKEIIPTLYTLRTCEGAYDLRFAVTLWNLAEKKKDLPAAKSCAGFPRGHQQTNPGRLAAAAQGRDRRRSIPRAVYQILEGRCRNRFGGESRESQEIGADLTLSIPKPMHLVS